jgi:hypothetical protein
MLSFFLHMVPRRKIALKKLAQSSSPSTSSLLAQNRRPSLHLGIRQVVGLLKTGSSIGVTSLGQIPPSRPGALSVLSATRNRPTPTLQTYGTCHLYSGSSGIVVATSIILLFSFIYFQASASPYTDVPCPPGVHSPSVESTAMSTVETPPGRPGNLTPEQEEKLRRLWSLILEAFGRGESNEGDAEANRTTASSEQAGVSPSDKSKRKRSLFGRKTATHSGADNPPPGASSVLGSLSDADPDDKYGQVRQYLDALANQSPESIRETLWAMVKHDHPDALVLRFLRARKWDVEKALVMLISTMNWRLTEMHVDDDIMKNGEGGALAAAKGEDGPKTKLGHDFLAQLRMGKAFLHGRDKAGRPICFVRVRLHRQGDHCEESLERTTVFIIETARLLLNPPVDTAVCCPCAKSSLDRH